MNIKVRGIKNTVFILNNIKFNSAFFNIEFIFLLTSLGGSDNLFSKDIKILRG